MKILGKYEIVEKLGQGGYATVYKARDPGLDRTVALKLLHQHAAGDPGFVERFRREARSAANLSHPNIVTIYELGEVEGQFYIAMRYLPGPTLANLIEDEAPVSPERAVELLAPVAEALDYAHGRDLIHRDVKPSNIILDENGRPVLTDFGLVRAETDASAATLSLTGMTLGTPQYMAPEQADPDHTGTLDHHCDVYSLGVVAYELLTGRPPFRGTPVKVLMAQVGKSPPLPREVNPQISEAVEAVLLRALAKAPAERFEGAGAFVTALKEGEPVRRTPSDLVIVGSSEELQKLDPLPERILWEPDGAEMVLVPAGSFLMGTPEEETRRLAEEFGKDLFSDETPQREVELNAYYVDRTPVTNAEYARFLAAYPGHEVPYREEDWAQPYNWDREHRTPPAGREDHPVVLVSWHDAVAYCEWAGKRLPTEAEWEKAARGTDGRRWPWGNRWDGSKCNNAERLAGCLLRTYEEWDAWRDEWDEQGPVQRSQDTTTPAGSYPTGASPYGAMDVAGNVWEWCADWYGEDYYAQAPSRNPQGSESGRSRVLRGGSWDFVRSGARCAYRYWSNPNCHIDIIGFRCCAAATSSL